MYFSKVSTINGFCSFTIAFVIKKIGHHENPQLSGYKNCKNGSKSEFWPIPIMWSPGKANVYEEKMIVRNFFLEVK